MIPTNQQAVIDFLNSELKKLFPNSGFKVVARKIMGETNIHIYYMNAPSVEDCSYKIIENDPAFMSFSIWNNHKAPQDHYVERPIMHRSGIFDAIGVKRFVTIRGTEMECAQKLVKWFAKYAQKIIDIGY